MTEAIATHERQCFQHPDIEGGTLQCRLCEKWACVDCRESQFGSGIPVVVCAECAAAQRRKRQMRSLGSVFMILLVVALIAGVYLSPYAYIMALPILILFWYLRFRFFMGTGGAMPGAFGLSRLFRRV